MRTQQEVEAAVVSLRKRIKEHTAKVLDAETDFALKVALATRAQYTARLNTLLWVRGSNVVNLDEAIL